MAEPRPGKIDNVAGDRDSDDDPRLAFIYKEALRGLLQQQAVVESMNNRAGSLIVATAFASSLLGGTALADGLGAWDWIALPLPLQLALILLLLEILAWLLAIARL
jgi:hypothetical protein